MRILLTVATLAVFGFIGFQAYADNTDKHEDTVLEEIGHEIDEVTDEMGIEDDESTSDEIKHELDELDDEAKARAKEAEEEMKDQ
jgi:hypothetical protein